MYTCTFQLSFNNCINFVNSIAPAGPPLSLSAIALGPTSIQISWQQPLPNLLNGILRDYSIEIVSNRTGEVFSHFTSTQSIVVSSLRPYTVYLYRVAAVTVETGPYSQTLAVPTDIAGKYMTFTQCRIYL